MLYTPFGYKIINGQAEIDESTANQIEHIFQNYLSGMTLIESAKEVGLEMKHASVRRILQNKHYLGDDFYPSIIDADTFSAANAEIARRSEKLGRINRQKMPEKRKIPTIFRMQTPTQQFVDPIKQAEYLYSLITSEVISNDNQ